MKVTGGVKRKPNPTTTASGRKKKKEEKNSPIKSGKEEVQSSNSVNNQQQNVFPFWNDDSAQISDLLMLPTQVVSQTSTQQLPADRRSWYTLESKKFIGPSEPHRTNWKEIQDEIHKIAVAEEEAKEKPLKRNVCHPLSNFSLKKRSFRTGLTTTTL